jgi:hypothetical protein
MLCMRDVIFINPSNDASLYLSFCLLPSSAVVKVETLLSVLDNCVERFELQLNCHLPILGNGICAEITR